MCKANKLKLLELHCLVRLRKRSSNRGVGARVYGVGNQSLWCWSQILLWWSCDFSVSSSPFGLDFGTLDFGLGLDNYKAANHET